MSDIHVMFRGRQDDLKFDDLFSQDRFDALGITEGTVLTPSSVNQDQIRMALAQKYDVGLDEFKDHAIEVSANGNITVRANTPFGEN
jgi:hypothetical protein